jgi:hypothetical protein
MSEFLREITPPGPLEDRVVNALRALGLVGRSRRRRAVRAGMAFAAALLLFAGGFLAGASRGQGSAASPAGGSRFVLLLHETPATASLGTREDLLVDEYRRWARTVSAGGNAIRGDKLKAEPGHTLSGFFVLEAPSLDAARAIAASCPHVKYGGRVEVREIEPT